MKIVSDNSELLDEIYKELKLSRVKVQKETKTVDGAMSSEMTIALDIFHQAKAHYDDIAFVIGGVIQLGKYLKDGVKVQKKDGTLVSFKEFENMSLEEKKEIF